MTEKFIEKSILVHGNKYDYSKVDYKKSNTKVSIICKIHGEFQQTPSHHINNHGCSKCVGKYIYNTNEIIEKFILVHENKYDYSKVDYKKMKIKVSIICKIHGEFQQLPSDHLNGFGCSKCSGICKLNTYEFIEKSILVHENKYDYSKVDYKNSNTKVKIICKIHGEFQQLPYLHINSSGCSKCSGYCKSNTNEFIEKSILVHENKYDYSKVDYKNNKTKVKIICKIHGEFLANPKSHLKKIGCAKCAGCCKSNTTEFIEKSKLVHGNKYDYSKIEYKNSNTKVKIICKIHGEFEQRPSDHLNNFGCSKCSGCCKSNTSEFIEKSKLVHKNKYDYSKVEYKNSNTKVKIICKIHGEFEQTPSHHLNKVGCAKCAGCCKSNTSEFIEKSNLVHGNKYDYSNVDYKNANIKVKIICKIHGEFEQKPCSHYNFQGCPKCTSIGYSKPQIKWLNFLSKFYNINIQHAENNEEFLIPNTKYKADGYCKENNTIYEFHGDYWHGNPKIFNHDEINKQTNCSFRKLYEKTLIREEKIKKLGYNLKVIWENEWNKINKCIKILQQKFKTYKKIN